MTKVLPREGRGRLVLAFWLASLLLLQLTLSLSAPAAEAATIPNTDVVPYGVNTFLDKEVEPWKKERTMQLINQSGVKWIKQLFAWNEIEFKKGYFNDDKNKKSAWAKYDEIVNLAAKYDVKIVARIDQTPAWAKPLGGQPGGHPTNYQDYADFLKAFVQHYKGKIGYITVWNEPNLEREWQPGQPVNPAQYVQMLKLAYQAVKSVDPTVKVLAAPLAITLEEKVNLSELTYLDQMYKNGAKDFFDIMPANAYGLEFAPDAAPDPTVLNYRRVELLHNVMVKNNDANKAVWFNEYGWNASPQSVDPATVKWRRVTEQQQADYTIQGMQYARQNWPWAGVIFVWFFRQVGDIPDTNSEQYFQLVTKDFAPKPVYNSIKQDALQYLQQKGLPLPAPVKLAESPTGTPVAVATTAATATTQAATTQAVTTTIAATTTQAITPVGTVVASVPKPTVAPPVSPTTAQPANDPTSDSGSLVPIIIGGVLVLAAGGGLGFWALRRRQG